MPARTITRIFIISICALLTISLFWYLHTKKMNDHTNVIINKPTPAFILPTLYDQTETISNDDFIGHVTLLHIWNSKVTDNENEHTLLFELANTRDLTMIGFITKDTIQSAQQWLNTHGDPYHYVIFDRQGDIASKLEIDNIPTTFIIDKKGMMRYQLNEPITEDLWVKTLEPLITQLRNETL